MGLVYVVVLNWNGWRDTVECLDSLLQQDGVDYRIVVCDNASTDGSLAQLHRWAAATLPDAYCELSRMQVDAGAKLPAMAKLALVDTLGNLGFAGGNNVGIQLAMADPRCDYVWLLNNDTTLAPKALASAVRHARQDTAIGICGSTLVYYHERDKIQAWGGARYKPLTGRSTHLGAFLPRHQVPSAAQAASLPLSYIVGAAMLVSRAFIEQVGLMHEDYFLYYEELDWALRGKGRFKLGYQPESVVYHKEGASIGTSAAGGSALSLYYLYRNRVRLTWRFYPLCLPTVLAAIFYELAKMGLRGRWLQLTAAMRGTLQLARA